MVLTDKQFYKAALNLGIEELKKAKEAYFAGDAAGAAKIFATYVRENLDYEHFFKLPGADIGDKEKAVRAADRVMEGYFWAAGYTYQYKNLEVDWEKNQTPNNYGEYVWQLSRHGEFSNLAKGYLHTGDKKYAEGFCKLIESWIDQVEFPIADIANRHGSYDHTGWRTLESGIRMGMPWQVPIFTFMRDGLIPDLLVVKIFKSIWEHAFHLRNYCSSHNWLLSELMGFAHIAILYPFYDKVAAWRKFIFDRLISELSVQIYPEGFQYELTTGYHLVSIKEYLNVVNLCKAFEIEVPAVMMEKIHQMYIAEFRLMGPDLECLGLNDGSYTPMYNYAKTALQHFPGDPFFTAIATDGKEGAWPDFNSDVFPYVGHCMMRTGWDKDAIFAHFDSAYYGWGHAHEDKLSFNLHAYGKRLLSDGGNFAYDTSKMRSMTVSTRAHNTALVDMKDQRRGYNTDFRKIEENAVINKIPSDLSWRFGDTYEVAEGLYDCGYGANPAVFVDHHRKVIFFKKGLGIAKPFFILLDAFKPKDEAEHLYEVLFQLDIQPYTVAEKTVTVDHGDGVTLSLVSSAPANIIVGQNEPRYMGWRKIEGHSGEDIVHNPAPAVLFTEKGRETFVATAAYPAKDGEGCAVASVVCDKDTFTITMTDGKAYTFEKNDPAFATAGAAERLEKGMPLR
ncbi:MAG: heparinase II/III family protein [Clostridia bacterium]|nr:heparinase II/III family protein [Clostridia bacterium]